MVGRDRYTGQNDSSNTSWAKNPASKILSISVW